MTQPNETQERLKQRIRKTLQTMRRVEHDDVHAHAYVRDVTKLLSLIDTRAPVDSQGSAELPEWSECQSMFADGTATALSEFIRAYEPVQSTNPDDTAADDWRKALSAVVHDAATQMRTACVETIRALRPSATGAGAFKDAAIKALGAVTLDQVKRK